MANTVLNKAIINKISKVKYDELVNLGTITPTMIREQLWVFNDDQYVSAADKTNWDNKANMSDIPTKNSQLTNDSNFITSADIPKKVSAFTNDKGYITSEDIPENLSEFNNDVGYITQDNIPKNISAFTNDMGYISQETDPTVPSWAKQSTKPTYTKDEIGLGNVENKSSATIRSEITSTNVINALGYTPISITEKGANDGVATLDSEGKVPSSQLPSYVDDVLEFDTRDDFPTTGESGKVYIAKDTNVTYRWSGTTYAIIGSDLALGETHSTAYYGDLGKIAYDHSQSAHAPSNAQANLIESISVNGTTKSITNKNVDIDVPTKTSDITNDSGFIDKTVNNLDNYYKKTETYNQTEINNLISGSGFFNLITEPTYAETLAPGNYLMKGEGEIIFRKDITKTADRYIIHSAIEGDLVNIQTDEDTTYVAVLCCCPDSVRGHSDVHNNYNQSENCLSSSILYLSQDSDGNYFFLDSTVLESQMNHGMFDIRSQLSVPWARYTGKGVQTSSVFGVAIEDFEQAFHDEDGQLIKTVTIPKGSISIGNPQDTSSGVSDFMLIITPTFHGYKIHTNAAYVTLLDEFDIATISDIPTKLSELENDKHYITSTDNSIKNIVEITYADYKELENLNEIDPDTEYHIIETGQTGSIEYEIRRIIQEMDEAKHPIGSLEFNVSGTNPSTYLGFGTWELWGAGRVPIGVDSSDSSINTADKTIGSKTASTTYTPAGTNTGTAITLNAVELTHSGGAVQSHTLTAAQSGLPSHSHTSKGWADVTDGSGSYRVLGAQGVSQDYSVNSTGGQNASSGHSHGFTQPSKHSFTPTTKSITQPTFTGTQATITESTIQPSISCYMWKRTA